MEEDQIYLKYIEIYIFLRKHYITAFVKRGKKNKKEFSENMIVERNLSIVDK